MSILEQLYAAAAELDAPPKLTMPASADIGAVLRRDFDALEALTVSAELSPMSWFQGLQLRVFDTEAELLAFSVKCELVGLKVVWFKPDRAA